MNDNYGFIGLGNIGAPMAKHLLDRPQGLVVLDLEAKAMAPFVEGGATAATSAAQVGEECSVISLMVLNDSQVRMVCDEILTTAPAGTVIAIHSTIHPKTAVEVGTLAARTGVDVVDAPVSGGFMGAHEASLAVMVGGSSAAFEKVREPFSEFADLVLHMGELGAGTKTKLARNLMHFTAFTAAGEAMRLAEANELSIHDLAKVVRHSDGVTGGPGAIMLRDTTAPMAPHDDWHDTLSHVRALGEKDLVLALELAADSDVELPLARLALNRLGSELGL